jgi:hypothetical protein
MRNPMAVSFYYLKGKRHIIQQENSLVRMYTMEQSLNNFSDCEADTQSRPPVTFEAEIPRNVLLPIV